MRKILMTIALIIAGTLGGNWIGKEMFGPILWPGMLFVGAIASGAIGFTSMLLPTGKPIFKTLRGQHHNSSGIPAGSIGAVSPKPYRIAVGNNLRPDNRIYTLFGGLLYGLFLMILGALQTPH